MIILGVDPGPIETAWVLYDSELKNIISFAKESNDEFKIRMIGDPLRLFKLPNEYTVGPEHMAIEMIASYGMAVGKSVFETCVWIGRFIERWGPAYTLIYRKDVKLHLCNNPRAKDSNIRQALIDKFGPPGTRKNPGKTHGISKDCWSALAVAVTFAEVKNA